MIINITNNQLFTFFKNLNENSESIIFNKKIKQIMSIRNAIKYNFKEFNQKYLILSELISDLYKEVFQQYQKEGKTSQKNDKILEKYVNDFTNDLNKKLLQLSKEKIQINVQTFSKENFQKFLSLNDGQLIENDIEFLELFIQKKEDNK